MLYSQSWLMSQGLVSSSELLPGTAYQVVVRIWNNSYAEPAAGLEVQLGFIHIGFGNTRFAIGSTAVNLGVKGSAHCPVFATFVGHTPAEPGHYCLQAVLVWPDDANPNNNLGQENTLVGMMHSPADFVFTATNDATVERRFELEADMYSIPPPAPCPET